MIFASTRYIETVEADKRQMREDYENRLREKDAEIRRLRAELGSRGVHLPTPDADRTDVIKTSQWTPVANAGPLDWQGELSELLKEEEGKDNGISG